MTLETKSTLTESTLNKLQKLIRANIDSYNGFHESAEEMKDAKVKALFKQIGDERSTMATDVTVHESVQGFRLPQRLRLLKRAEAMGRVGRRI